MFRAIQETSRMYGARVELLFEAVMQLHGTWRRRSQIADQLYVAGVQVTHVVLLVGLFAGMIMALQTGLYLAQLGQQDQIGVIVALSMAREMGPFITGIVLAATAGSALAAELGTMSVSDELAALEVMSVDRTNYLVMPRVVALAIACPILTIIADGIGIAGGGLVASTSLNVELQLYFITALDALKSPGDLIALPKDVYSGLLKAFVFGIIIAVISCHAGITTRGGALGVGRATRQAVRDSIITIIISNYFLTWLMYQA
ncbi:MlaE family ABC transporter permease [Engelhardtia mirabilis]|uniref:ABC transport permease subunit MlaE n=1 Tax=Engelhardtia mirabilis TaxID=2528011 RepID=A0A518BPG3_9BACT|nr:ABC transport permease subunit MlaE [Planctomycetes bacterium Pla133]QDV03194.1 ABC transport permease subunit MlaE [Planctomycetes bacterium Pla86]